MDLPNIRVCMYCFLRALDPVCITHLLLVGYSPADASFPSYKAASWTRRRLDSTQPAAESPDRAITITGIYLTILEKITGTCMDETHRIHVMAQRLPRTVLAGVLSRRGSGKPCDMAQKRHGGTDGG